MNEHAISQQQIPLNLGIMESPAKMEMALKAAEYFAQSPMLPDTYRGNPGSCLIAVNTAMRLGLDPLMVMQNLYVVKGKPSWSGSFTRALINASGKYRETYYDWVNPEDETQGCCLVGVESSTGRIIKGPLVTPKMVKAEGWGMKWVSMPTVMFRYRAAALFARTECPEAILGLQTTEEVEDSTPRNISPKSQIFSRKEEKAQDASTEVVPAEAIPVEARPQSEPETGISADKEAIYDRCRESEISTDALNLLINRQSKGKYEDFISCPDAVAKSLLSHWEKFLPQLKELNEII